MTDHHNANCIVFSHCLIILMLDFNTSLHAFSFRYLQEIAQLVFSLGRFGVKCEFPPPPSLANILQLFWIMISVTLFLGGGAGLKEQWLCNLLVFVSSSVCCFKFGPLRFNLFCLSCLIFDALSLVPLCLTSFACTVYLVSFSPRVFLQSV